MNDDLISRQAAIDAFCNDSCGGHQDCKYYPWCESLRSVWQLPAVEAIPIAFIEKEAEKMQNSENPAMRMNSVILSALIRDWRENEKSN